MQEDVIFKRRNDLLKIVEELDITPTMYTNAVDKYTAIANLLEKNNINANIYPQGSFAIGTVIKPKTRKRKADYDLDVICEVNYNKASITPNDLYEQIKSVLASDGHYIGKLDYYDECITINYSDINGVGFSIDVVPSVHEDVATITSMKAYSPMPTLCDTAIAITTKKDLDWGSSNPKGFQSWFSGINQKFLDYDIHTNRSRILNENRAIFASVEDIPVQVIKTPLQRVIQLLKAHNNEYFDKPQIKDYKVRSVIITTLASTIASKAPSHLNTFELLQMVLNEMGTYCKLKDNSVLFKALYPDNNIIQFNGKEWYIENPSNPFDNLADSWNENSRNATYFFSWVSALVSDFKYINDSSKQVGMVNIFGESMLRTTTTGKQYIPSSSHTMDRASQSKPWRADE